MTRAAFIGRPARAGELRSKIYEPSSQYRLLIMLDINTYKEAWLGHDPELQELTISAATSIALDALEQGYSVGLLANSLMMAMSGDTITGDEESFSPEGLTPRQSPTSINMPAAHAFIHRVRVPLASDSGQPERILTALGRLLPYFGSPMDVLIDAERFMLPIGTTVVLVSAAAVLSEATMESLVDLRAHGSAVHLALTGEQDELSADTYDLPVYWLGGRETWYELINTLDTDQHEGSGRSATSFHLA